MLTMTRFFFRTWWIILFALACYFAYEQGMRSREMEYASLKKRYLESGQERQRLLRIQEDLLLQINSQSDPAWVELVLIKGLGLVPEGQTKVYFESRSLQ